MKILFVSLFLPQQKAYHAGGRYVNELVRRLSRQHEIHLATRLEQGEEPLLAELAPYCAAIHPFSYPRLPKRGMLASLRLAANYLAFSIFANRLIQKGDYDLVQVEWVETAVMIRRGATPMVLDAHDVITKPARRSFERSRGMARAAGWVRWRLVRLLEVAIMARFDRIFTMSDFDRRYLLDLAPALRVTTVPIPAGMDLTPASYPRVPGRLLFLASYKYRPTNVEAALWFHAEVLPLVRRDVPEAEFVIAGFGPPPRLLELAERDPATRVTGFVDDTDQLYKSASVFVAPILTGGGIIVKVLDALAAGTPVVTTTFGNEGIGAVPGRDVMVADTAREFAAAVVALLRDPAQAERLAASGSAFVAAHFSIAAVLERIESSYRELAAPGEGVPPRS
ncbi:glycosyltransferase family 4 protein [Geomonas azotofigens]|uniref:glycosyltransferase family 4 protein n=1 Tax=Geomonas azotofigens TaxID=2843196 RepID=UPI001C1075CB|nr:glycosyltransferase family 4 protein [Geomonas azotofigens]MBU5614566.1 glycosyltransferase family 4 protein [Geomonas azotofigens]